MKQAKVFYKPYQNEEKRKRREIKNYRINQLNILLASRIYNSSIFPDLKKIRCYLQTFKYYKINDELWVFDDTLEIFSTRYIINHYHYWNDKNLYKQKSGLSGLLKTSGKFKHIPNEVTIKKENQSVSIRSKIW